jgi:hypothetical protein
VLAQRYEVIAASHQSELAAANLKGILTFSLFVWLLNCLTITPR